MEIAMSIMKNKTYCPLCHHFTLCPLQPQNTFIRVAGGAFPWTMSNATDAMLFVDAFSPSKAPSRSFIPHVATPPCRAGGARRQNLAHVGCDAFFSSSHGWHGPIISLRQHPRSRVVVSLSAYQNFDQSLPFTLSLFHFHSPSEAI
jgi:hypothetical protein